MDTSLKKNEDVELPNNFLNTPLSVDFAQQKISEFSNIFNSICRIPLLSCDEADKEIIFYQLITLRKNIKHTLEDLGKGCSLREYHFNCGVCDAPITINAGQDFWSGLQAHKHFEQLVSEFLQNKLTINFDSSPDITGNMTKHNETSNSGDSNTDSGIDQPENEIIPKERNLPGTSRQQKSKENDVNSFRFNFPLKYHDSVASKIYPASLMESVQKFDKVKDYYTMQRAGPSKAACLVCPCELHSPRIHKKILTNHATGQRHMKSTSDHRSLELLRDYHEFWLKEDEFVQAHQVYFSLYNKVSMICVLCNVYVGLAQIRPHLVQDMHKRKVVDMFAKKNSAYYLIDLQVQLYGIVPEKDSSPKESHDENNPKPVKTDRRQNRSESDHSREGQRHEGNDEEYISHIIKKSVLDPTSPNVFDLIPNRFKEDLKNFKRVKKQGSPFILCKICNLEMPNKIEHLEEHIVFTASHAKLRKDKYKYFCEICNKQEPSEVMWYKHNWNGPRHENMAESRKARVTEYECTTCKTVLFGDELSLKRHLAIGDRSGRNKDKIVRLPEQLKVIFKNTKSILNEADRLKSQADEALNSNQTRECCDKIQSALREIYSHCKVYPFGSRVTGIGNKESDLDVFVDIGGMYTGEQQQDARDQVLIIRQAAKAFTKRETPTQWAHIVKVDTARTPILKLHHIPTKLDCDLSFRHGLSVENTKFLRLCMDLQPTARKLVMLVKKWAEHLIYEKISTYALVTMVIFYMQINNYLLSLEAIRLMEKTESLIISGWKTLAHNLPKSELEKHITPYPNQVHVLAKAFFEYYAKFDFNTYIVCPLLGRLIPKSHFLENNGSQLPKEMDTYLDQLTGEDPEYFRANSLMCIQDPFDLSHNLTKAVQQGTLGRFQTMCKLTAEHMDLQTV